MSTNHIKGVHGDMRQILPLHRSTLVDYDLDRKRAADAAADAPDLFAPAPVQPIKTVEDELPWLWMLYGVVILATVAACSVIASYA